jgi:hypothetical protein
LGECLRVSFAIVLQSPSGAVCSDMSVIACDKRPRQCNDHNSRSNTRNSIDNSSRSGSCKRETENRLKRGSSREEDEGLQLSNIGRKSKTLSQ